MDLKAVHVVMPAEVYQRLINHLVNNFTYAQIYKAMKDLEDNAFEVPNELVIPFSPFISKENEVTFFGPTISGVDEARKADQEEVVKLVSTEESSTIDE